MKKIFTLFFAASLTTAAFAQDAVTFVVDNVEYVVTSETTVGLNGLTNEFTATELTVPSEVVNEGKNLQRNFSGRRSYQMVRPDKTCSS